MHKTLLALLISLASTAVLAAGQHDGGHHQASAEADRTLAFEAGDMWFTPGQLDVAPGETIRFEITNTGDLEHEFVIGDAQAQEQHRQMMREMASTQHHDEMANGMHAGGHHGSGHGHGADMPAVTIAPGETATLVWTAPEGTDKVEFACNIPGHYEAGMSGHIRIEG